MVTRTPHAGGWGGLGVGAGAFPAVAKGAQGWKGSGKATANSVAAGLAGKGGANVASEAPSGKGWKGGVASNAPAQVASAKGFKGVSNSTPEQPQIWQKGGPKGPLAGPFGGKGNTVRPPANQSQRSAPPQPPLDTGLRAATPQATSEPQSGDTSILIKKLLDDSSTDAQPQGQLRNGGDVDVAKSSLWKAAAQLSVLKDEMRDTRAQFTEVESAPGSGRLLAWLAQSHERLLGIEDTVVAELQRRESDIAQVPQMVQQIAEFQRRLDVLEGRGVQGGVDAAPNAAAGGPAATGGCSASSASGVPATALQVKRSADTAGVEDAHTETHGMKRQVLKQAALQVATGPVAIPAPQAPKVVRARITRLSAPDEGPLGGVTIEQVHSRFALAGAVEKIVCLTSPVNGPPFDYVDAMIQYASADRARNAVEFGNPSNLNEDGSNSMDVAFSEQRELFVPANTPQCRDYITKLPQVTPIAAIVPALNTAALPGDTAAFGAPSTVAVQVPQQLVEPPQSTPTPKPPRVLMANVSNLASPNEPPLGGLNVEIVYDAFHKFGAIEKIILGPDPAPLPLFRATALVQFSDRDALGRAMHHCQGTSLTRDGYRNTLELSEAGINELCVIKDGQLSWDFTRQTSSGVALPGALPDTVLASS